MIFPLLVQKHNCASFLPVSCQTFKNFLVIKSFFLFIGVILYRNPVRPLCKQGDDYTKSGTEFSTWRNW